ncbi:MAG: hypothetical protein K5855_07080, partial [Oscillospiraceae bacterium]|nr:hypothetical protein [Oscillospiraceae bacterium]
APDRAIFFSSSLVEPTHSLRMISIAPGSLFPRRVHRNNDRSAVIIHFIGTSASPQSGNRRRGHIAVSCGHDNNITFFLPRQSLRRVPSRLQ